MRVIVRSVGVALLVIVAAVLLALTQTMTSVFTLAVVTGNTYIVKGTQFGVPLCAPSCGTLATDQQNIALATPYITSPRTTNSPPPGTVIVVPYPASFWPISTGYIFDPTYNQAVAQGVAALPPPNGPNGIQSGSVIFGYSQGAEVATIYKRNFNAAWASNPTGAPPVTFVLIGNGSRPNGGAMERFAGLSIPGLGFSFIGATPTQTAGATPGQITTYDIARQYDGFADFPTNPLNPFATANAMMGMLLLHQGYGSVDMSQAVFQGNYGDTAYYLIPTYPLPLLMPVQMIPVFGPVLADTLDPALRVLVEAGYNRTISPGVPTPANFLYFPNPATLTTNFLVAIPTGLDNGIGDLAGVRPFGTLRPLAANGYVVGGPSLTLPNQPNGNPNPAPTPLSLTGWFNPAANPSPAPQQTAASSLATQQTAASSTWPAAPPDYTPPQTQTQSSTASSVTTTPEPLAKFVPPGPRLNVITGGPIGGSPTAPGVNRIASTAITGAINAAAAAAAGAAAAATGGAPGR